MGALSLGSEALSEMSGPKLASDLVRKCPGTSKDVLKKEWKEESNFPGAHPAIKRIDGRCR